MAIVDPERFADKEVARVYIAGRLGEARGVEQALSDNGVDYVVETETFETYLLGILPTKYDGVAFYVQSGQASLCRRILREAGLKDGLVEQELE
jgi:glucose-6-phosphate 1-dehydrogenase